MVIFHIPGALRQFTGGCARVPIVDCPATLTAAFAALWALYPALRDRVLTEQGQIREHINVFIGEEDIRYLGGLASRISAEAEISIVPSITGGSTSFGASCLGFDDISI
jgi:molybdopterin synthase sulfur carrier subunit